MPDRQSEPAMELQDLTQTQSNPVLETSSSEDDKPQPGLLSQDSHSEGAAVTLSLDAAAALLIDQLTGQVPNILKEIAAQQHLRLWMYVCGLMQRAYDNGEHTIPTIEPMWTAKLESKPQDHGDAFCACGCGEPFHRRWPGQLYKDNVHGARAAAASRGTPHVLAGPTHPVGQEPEGAAKSTLSHQEAWGLVSEPLAHTEGT